MARNIKYWKRRFGDTESFSPDPYPRHLDLRRIDDLDDEGLAYLLTNIKGVDMLDLNETEISNESITLLSSLEYIKELQLKGCRIDNDCIPDLGKIKALEFLHVKNTSITIDGLLQLEELPCLNRLMFSDEDAPALKEKMLKLRDLFPQCDFTVNSVPYSFDE